MCRTAARGAAAELARRPDELATSIARFLRLQLVLDHQVETVRRKTRVPEAAEHHRAAMVENYGVNQGGHRDVDVLLANAQRANELDPSIVNVYDLLASAYWELSILGRMPWRRASDLSHAALDRGQALDSNNSLLHYQRAVIQHILDLDYEAAAASFEIAIARAPLHPNVRWFHHGLGLLAVYRGDLRRARHHYNRAIRIYEADMRVYQEYACMLLWSGAHGEALDTARTGLRLGWSGSQRYALDEIIIRAHLGLGHVDRANELLDDAVLRLGQRAQASAYAANLYFLVGRHDEGLRIIETMKRSLLPRPEQTVFAFRHVDRDVAFDCLHECIAAHSRVVIPELRNDPAWHGLRKDPRWHEVMRHLEHEEAVSGRSRRSP